MAQVTKLGRNGHAMVQKEWVVSWDVTTLPEDVIEDDFRESVALDVLNLLIYLTEVNDANGTRLIPRISIETEKMPDDRCRQTIVRKTLQFDILGDDCPRCGHQGKKIEPPNIVMCRRCGLIEKDRTRHADLKRETNTVS